MDASSELLRSRMYQGAHQMREIYDTVKSSEESLNHNKETTQNTL